MVTTTKASMKVTPSNTQVVSKHRLAEAEKSAVFPEHIGESLWHKGPRQGHPGAYQSKATMKKSG